MVENGVDFALSAPLTVVVNHGCRRGVCKSGYSEQKTCNKPISETGAVKDRSRVTILTVI